MGFTIGLIILVLSTALLLGCYIHEVLEQRFWDVLQDMCVDCDFTLGVSSCCAHVTPHNIYNLTIELHVARSRNTVFSFCRPACKPHFCPTSCNLLQLRPTTETKPYIGGPSEMGLSAECHSIVTCFLGHLQCFFSSRGRCSANPHCTAEYDYDNLTIDLSDNTICRRNSTILKFSY